MDLKEKLAKTIRDYNQKGWSPATSTNYSFKDENATIWVSKSGVDKSEFSGEDFITIDAEGNPTGTYKTVRPSAETLIHCVLYELFPQTGVILHSHSVFPLLIASEHQPQVVFQGYEVQKGFSGETSHEAIVAIPVFDNTQDMVAFAQTIRNNVAAIKHHCFIMRNHGTYAWGENLFEAKRHLETLEYLSELSYRTQLLNQK